MPVEIGMVHGRFQPFHKGHWEYVEMALSLCERLVVGITNPEPSEYVEEQTSLHRHLPDANPFTFFHRAEMIRASLIQAGIGLGRVAIVPFHLFAPEKWSCYLPRPSAITHFVRVFSAWEEKKIAFFQARGFAVNILDRGAKKLDEGMRIRHLMKSGGDWRPLVTEGTAKVIDQILSGLL